MDVNVGTCDFRELLVFSWVAICSGCKETLSSEEVVMLSAELELCSAIGMLLLVLLNLLGFFNASVNEMSKRSSC